MHYADWMLLVTWSEQRNFGTYCGNHVCGWMRNSTSERATVLLSETSASEREDKASPIGKNLIQTEKKDIHHNVIL